VIGQYVLGKSNGARMGKSILIFPNKVGDPYRMRIRLNKIKVGKIQLRKYLQVLSKNSSQNFTGIYIQKLSEKVLSFY
jgi:hypothetical protein